MVDITMTREYEHRGITFNTLNETNANVGDFIKIKYDSEIIFRGWSFIIYLPIELIPSSFDKSIYYNDEIDQTKCKLLNNIVFPSGHTIVKIQNNNKDLYITHLYKMNQEDNVKSPNNHITVYSDAIKAINSFYNLIN